MAEVKDRFFYFEKVQPFSIWPTVTLHKANVAIDPPLRALAQSWNWLHEKLYAFHSKLNSYTLPLIKQVNSFSYECYVCYMCTHAINYKYYVYNEYQWFNSTCTCANQIHVTQTLTQAAWLAVCVSYFVVHSVIQ